MQLPKHLGKNAANTFQVPLSFAVNVSRNFLHSRIFLICGSIETLDFVTACEILENKFFRYLNWFEFLSNAITSCLIKPNFMSKGDINILVESVTDSYLTFLFRTENFFSAILAYGTALSNVISTIPMAKNNMEIV